MRIAGAFFFLAVIAIVGFLVVKKFAPGGELHSSDVPNHHAPAAPAVREWSEDEMAKDPAGYLKWGDEQIQGQIQQREDLLGQLEERRNQFTTRSRQAEQGTPLAQDYDAAITKMDARAASLRRELTALAQLREKIAIDRGRVELSQGVAKLEEPSRLAQQIGHYSKMLGQVADAAEPLLERLARSRQAVAITRALADASVNLKEAMRLEIDAEECVKAGETERGIAELVRAREAYAALMPGYRQATLEEMVAARTAMIAAREEIKELPAEPGPGEQPKPGSMSDLMGRALAAEGAASDAHEDRQYGSARILFVAAEKLYRDFAVLQAGRAALMASRESVTATMKLADAAFRTAARPASFERGRQGLADADKALEENDLETATQRLAEAAEQFGAAYTEAQQGNALAEALQAWSAASSVADQTLLSRHAAERWEVARKQAADGQAKASAGDAVAATTLLQAATGSLAGATAEAIAAATAMENAAKTAPLVERLEAAIARKEKAAAEELLGQVEALSQGDPKVIALRDKVKALPWPAKASVDLGRGVVMELLLIPPGEFLMGSPEGEQGRGTDESQHKVELTRTFYMGVTEVTQAQWKAVMGTTPSSSKGDDLPVEQVSWKDARAFCEKLSRKTGAKYRLPTEAEWEYACRAGTTDARYGQVHDVAWYGENSSRSPQPVAAKNPNAYGLHDMLGNVYEWCSDWYGPYATNDAGAQDPVGAGSGSARVVRGGSWGYDPTNCRAANRVGFDPAGRYHICGFRVVWTP